MENDSRKMANWNEDLHSACSYKSIYAYIIIREAMKLKALLQNYCLKFFLSNKLQFFNFASKWKSMIVQC